MPRTWSQAEDDIIRAEPMVGDHILAKRIAAAGGVRSVRSVQERRVHLGFYHANNVRQPDKDELVHKHYIVEGLSASRTAQIIGGGATKNSVVGIASRRGWKRNPDIAVQNCRRSPGDRGRHMKVARTPTPVPAAKAFQHGAGCDVGAPKPPTFGRKIAPVAGSLNARMWEPAFTSASCAFPTGEADGEHLFCCLPKLGGWPYCVEHVFQLNGTREPKKARPLPVDRPARARRTNDDEPQPLDVVLAA